jgi:CheY-like chemotaxis protein
MIRPAAETASKCEKEAAMASVIVIDDCPAICKMLKEVLTLERHEVVSATDPRVGLRMIESASPSVVILNLMMPHLNGAAILDRLRATPDVRARHEIILYSANYRLEAVAREYGVERILVKPANADQIIAAVSAAEQALQGRGSRT